VDPQATRIPEMVLPLQWLLDMKSNSSHILDKFLSHSTTSTGALILTSSFRLFVQPATDRRFE
jgi:hypothetical protein